MASSSADSEIGKDAVLNGLTERQASILAFIREFQVANGAGPSLLEIGERFDIKSPHAVVKHIGALEKKGALRRGRNASGHALARAYVLSEVRNEAMQQVSSVEAPGGVLQAPAGSAMQEVLNGRGHGSKA